MNDVPQKYVSMVYNFDEQMVKNQNYCIYLSTMCYKYHISISKFHFEPVELEIIGTSLIKKPQPFLWLADNAMILVRLYSKHTVFT